MAQLLMACISEGLDATAAALRASAGVMVSDVSSAVEAASGRVCLGRPRVVGRVRPAPAQTEGAEVR